MVDPADEDVVATAAVEVRPKLLTVDVADLDPVGQVAPVNLLKPSRRTDPSLTHAGRAFVSSGLVNTN